MQVFNSTRLKLIRGMLRTLVPTSWVWTRRLRSLWVQMGVMRNRPGKQLGEEKA